MKTETSSFRLDKEIFTEFKKQAKRQGLSTNSLINKIMKEYIQWGSMASAIQMIPYPAPIIVELLKNSNEDQIKKIASNHAKEHFPENLLLMKNEETVDAYLEMAQNWCDSAGFPYSIKEKNEIINFTIRHNQGKLFSILLSEVMKCGIEELTKKRAEIKQTTNSVSFWI